MLKYLILPLFLILTSCRAINPVRGISSTLQNSTSWNWDHESPGPQKLTCPENWDDKTKDFHFDLAYYHCQERYGKSAQTCAERDPAKIQARAQNIELLEEMVTFAEKSFEDYKSKLAVQCCGSRTRCLKNFKATKLEILPDLVLEAGYVSSVSQFHENKVEITHGKLASAMNRESVERVLLVELAHACQFAVVSESESDYQKFTVDACDPTLSRNMFQAELGAEVGKCLDGELQSQIQAIPEEKRQNFCFGKWYREAFSDMKFRSEFTSIYHWTYDFLRRSQHKNYGSVYRYIKCGVTPELKAQVCK